MECDQTDNEFQVLSQRVDDWSAFENRQANSMDGIEDSVNPTLSENHNIN